MRPHYILMIILCGVLFVYQNCNQSSRSMRLPSEKSANPYLQKFIQEGNRRGINVNLDTLQIHFVSDEVFLSYLGQSGVSAQSMVGYCFFSPDYTADGNIEILRPNVLIRNKAWEALADYRRKDLIYHELGHCLLHREHSGSSYIYSALEIVRSLDIMNSILISYLTDENTYTQNESALLDKLFNKELNKAVISKSSKYLFTEEQGCHEIEVPD